MCLLRQHGCCTSCPYDLFSLYSGLFVAQVLLRLHAKRQIMNNMVAFLKNEEEFTETILATLHAAEEHGIDPEFIEKGERLVAVVVPVFLLFLEIWSDRDCMCCQYTIAESVAIDGDAGINAPLPPRHMLTLRDSLLFVLVRGVYDKAGPRLKSRNRLRHMIESVDRFGIEHSCLEVLEIQKMQPGFAESELRAAKAMLRLLHFDAELSGEDQAAELEEGQDHHVQASDEGGEGEVNAVRRRCRWVPESKWFLNR